jgi:hypothetical protein
VTVQNPTAQRNNGIDPSDPEGPGAFVEWKRQQEAPAEPEGLNPVEELIVEISVLVGRLNAKVDQLLDNEQYSAFLASWNPTARNRLIEVAVPPEAVPEVLRAYPAAQPVQSAWGH